MESVLLIVLYVSLIVHIILIGISVWRVWRGENIIDRLMGADLISTLTLAILVLLALFEKNTIFIDVAVGLVALGYVSTIALAKYIADEQMF
ncbi:MAG TPA: monovalent cation/H+ antiporter complex subunit F [Methylophilaceae bacterium]|jgi:multisubunit Na+/H+ antiporter MnhF subunit|nr:monovalent cation/H+ antiporter complex subunit F [Methylophilaceae bacterium]